MSDCEEEMAEGDIRWLKALEWHTQLQQTPATELTRERIHAWREWVSDEQNQRIFDQVTQLVGDGPALREYVSAGRSAIAYGRSDSTGPEEAVRALPDVRRASTRTALFRGFGIRMLVAASVAALLLGSVFMMPRLKLHEQTPSTQSYETNLAEVHRVSLADGSTVTLGARTTIQVQFSHARRSVRLDRGQAWFQVARNPERPFVVTAGTGTITALGTAFVVERESGRVVVTVTDGVVQWAPRSATAGNSPAESSGVTLPSSVQFATARVARGEQISYEDGGPASRIEKADPEAATAWSEGRLEFDHEPLSRVVAVVNRYSRRPITLDSAGNDYVFTGLVLQGQIDDWICGLQDIFPVQVIERGERLLVRPRGSGTLEVTASSPCPTAH